MGEEELFLTRLFLFLKLRKKKQSKREQRAKVFYEGNF